MIYNSTETYIIKAMVDKSGGIMVALQVPAEVAEKLALEGGQDASSLHVTLVYLGKAGEFGPKKMNTLHAICSDIARKSAPVVVHLKGYDVFPETEDGPCLHVAVEASEELMKLRDDVEEAVSSYGMPPKTDRPYAPHITLAYGESAAPPTDGPPVKSFVADWLWATFGKTEALMRMGEPVKKDGFGGGQGQGAGLDGAFTTADLNNGGRIAPEQGMFKKPKKPFDLAKREATNRSMTLKAFDESEHPRDESGRFSGAASFGRMSHGDLGERNGPPEEHMYHTTSAANLSDIADEGLQPHDPSHRGEQEAWPNGGHGKRVYFASRKAGALNFSEPDHVLLRVKTDKIPGMRSEFENADYYTSKPIEAEHIEVLQADGSWKPLVQETEKRSVRQPDGDLVETKFVGAVAAKPEEKDLDGNIIAAEPTLNMGGDPDERVKLEVAAKDIGGGPTDGATTGMINTDILDKKPKKDKPEAAGQAYTATTGNELPNAMPAPGLMKIHDAGAHPPVIEDEDDDNHRTTLLSAVAITNAAPDPVVALEKKMDKKFEALIEAMNRPKKMKKTVVRDANGDIAHVIEEEID